MARLFAYIIPSLEDVLQIVLQVQLMGPRSLRWIQVLAINTKLLSRIWLPELVTNICKYEYLLQY